MKASHRSALLALALTLVVTGCIERRFTIRSEPSGADVVLDGEPLSGPTPVTVALDHHGTHRVEVEGEGHRRVVTAARTATPWYDHFPLDLLAELWPGRIVSQDEVTVRLEERPQEGPPDEALDRLLGEGSAMRERVSGDD